MIVYYKNMNMDRQGKKYNKHCSTNKNHGIIISIHTRTICVLSNPKLNLYLYK